jgi:hypothetical protein
MIEIYRRVEGKDRLVRTFNTFEELFRVVWERDIANFGYAPTDRTDNFRQLFGEIAHHDPFYLVDQSHRYIAYEGDKLVTPDHLVGLYRAWIQTKRRFQGRWRSRKSARGSWRRIRTTQERRWAHAWDDEEFAPTVRCRRNATNLPNTWDDYTAHNEKGWKCQSKRRRQWKRK